MVKTAPPENAFSKGSSTSTPLASEVRENLAVAQPGQERFSRGQTKVITKNPPKSFQGNGVTVTSRPG
ncbi:MULTISPECIES: hypothetical protein [unclassified Amycolatopsis]|uniref:hypothetical protein n=1 Tax=unclassified Amycolatopsis TaxID=2618356 RepID=UPI001C698229|nr:hypothetical protein [Amycolatopsis sp. DSM 110486]QYN20835.1 hypothetical protein K1T34_51720 [Amycolatopsis sp. DSM 110486]